MLKTWIALDITVPMYVSNIKNNNLIVKWGRSSLIRVFATCCLFMLAAPVLAESPIDRAQQTTSKDPTEVDPRLDQLIHTDTTNALDVPPVYQRPLGVDAGARVFVKKFIVTGVNEWPEYGITQERIDAFVDRLRLELQTIEAMNEHGLIDEDLGDIGKHLKDSLSLDDEAAAQVYVKYLKQLRKNKKFREEMSIGQLQDVANRVTDLYRSAGFVIAQAYVPQQKIKDGVVKIHVQEGMLGQINVEGNKQYSTGLIKDIFIHLEGKSVTKQSLENALFSLSDYPGLVAYGVLQPGANTGETNLLVKVQEEDAREYTVRLDNYGTEITGKNRLTLSYTENNLFGNADSLDLSLLQAFSPSGNTFGGVKYKSPIGGHDTLLGLGLSNNAYEVGGNLGQFDISGTVNSTNIFVSHQFQRSRSSNIFGKVDFSHKVGSTEIGGNTFAEDDILSALVFESGFDVLDKKYKGINQGTVKLTQGLEGFLDSLESGDVSSRQGGSGDYATSGFTKLNWNVARLQLIDKYQNILLRFSGQYSKDLLVPLEQTGLGGPNNVRAFEPSLVLRDTSLFLSVDWNFNAPLFYNVKAFDGWKWGEILQFSAFADYVKGTNNDLSRSTDDGDVSLLGVGVAAQLLLPGEMQLRLDIAKPLSSNVPDASSTATSGGELSIEEIQFYLTFSYTG